MVRDESEVQPPGLRRDRFAGHDAARVTTFVPAHAGNPITRSI
jgi:hypothetical protein